jgi:hypothetical protein
MITSIGLANKRKAWPRSAEVSNGSVGGAPIYWTVSGKVRRLFSAGFRVAGLLVAGLLVAGLLGASLPGAELLGGPRRALDDAFARSDRAHRRRLRRLF